MKAIVAVDKNWAIGNKNQLLVRIPDDQKFFREKTTGGVVILGRRTLETFPNGAPLKNRVNIIITTDPNYCVPGAIVAHSIQEALEAAGEYDTNKVFVIGGESIYRQMVDLCDTVYVTKIDYAYEADAFFPNLDEKDEWEMTEISEEQTYFDVVYEFATYRKKS